jgi:sugar lactone lactonase YvrE
MVWVQGSTPIWVSSPITNATVGQTYEYLAVATDPAGGAVAFDAVTVPPWLSLVGVSTPRLYTVAGTLERGSGKPGLQVQLWTPNACAYDAAGNLYVADRNNHRVWCLAADGVMTTVAGTGAPGFDGDGGAAERARLHDPAAVAVGATGDLYIADRLNHRIRRVSTSGVIMTIAGTGVAGYGGDNGPALQALLQHPTGLALDAQGVLYIADAGNNRLRIISPVGIITTLAGTGTEGYNGENVAALQAWLAGPAGLTIEANGGVAFAEPGNNRVRRVTPDGRVQTIAGNGQFGSVGEGVPGPTARLASPQGVAVDAAGVLIADTLSSRIRRVGLDGLIRTVGGTGRIGFSGDGGPAAEAQLFLPAGLAIAPGGGYTIVDGGNDRVRRVDGAGVIRTIAGVGLYASGGDGGPATAATLLRPQGGAEGPGGVWYVADTYGQTIRRINLDRTIESIAGNGEVGFAGDDGPGTLARLDHPSDVVADGAGNVFISDTRNNRIRVVNAAGTIRTFAGTGNAGNQGDGGPAAAAQFSNPRGLARDGTGNLYVVDQGNSRVRRILTSGLVQAVAGTGEAGFAGDGGPALQAKFNSPEGLALDSAGNVFICDTANHRVRRVSPAGIITTVAGNGVAGFSGDGGQARNAALHSPMGVAVGEDGSLYLADYNNHRIRRVRPDGVIETVAGSGGVGSGGGGHAGDGGPPTEATLLYPADLQVLSSGSLLIVEQGLGFLRQVLPGGTVLRGTPSEAATGPQSVVLEARAGEAVSQQAFTLFVDTPPAVTSPPLSQQVAVGGTASFTVTATGTPPLSYQWLRNGAALSDGGRISGSATAQLSVANVQTGDAAQYEVIVLNNAGSVRSPAAQLTVGGAQGPTITQPPQPQSVAQGANAIFAVGAAGTPPLSYQWLRNGVALSDGGRISGSTTAQLVVANAQPEDAGPYEVIVSNTAASVRSQAVSLTVLGSQSPAITQPPQPQNVVQGANAVFAVGAEGTPPLGYQWSRDDVALSESPRFVGVHSPTLTIVGAQASDQGLYTVTVANALGSVTSEGVLLTVYPAPPVITQPPQSQTVSLGDPVSFEVVATATEPVGYQWFREGTLLADGGRFSGTRTSRLQIAAVEAEDAGDYRVSVEDAGGSVISTAGRLTIRPPGAPLLSNPTVQGAVVRFAVSGVAGQTCEIQHSSDLREWQRLTEIQLGEAPVEVTDPLTPGPRFYRAVVR